MPDICVFQFRFCNYMNGQKNSAQCMEFKRVWWTFLSPVIRSFFTKCLWRSLITSMAERFFSQIIKSIERWSMFLTGLAFSNFLSFFYFFHIVMKNEDFTNYPNYKSEYFLNNKKLILHKRLWFLTIKQKTLILIR